MAARTFYMNENDTLPDLQVTVKDGDDVVVDVTGATIKFSMKDIALGTLKINERSVTIVNGTSGIIKYVWQSDKSDTNVVGKYLCEFEVTFSGGAVLTFPGNTINPLYLVITAELS